jgi:hypothetical protein
LVGCGLIALLLAGCTEKPPPNPEKVNPPSQRLPKAGAPQ